MKKVILPQSCKQLIMRQCFELVIVTTLVMGNVLNVSASEGILTEEDLSSLYSYKQEEKVDTCLSLTVEDAEMLMKIAYHEDHSDVLSQAYIMSEVLNRVNSPDYPNTIKEVLDQKKQFIDTDSKEFKDIEPDANSHLALALIESGQIKTDFFYHEAISAVNSWQSKKREVSKEYGGTRFYR